MGKTVVAVIEGDDREEKHQSKQREGKFVY